MTKRSATRRTRRKEPRNRDVTIPAIPLEFEDALSRILRAKPPVKKTGGKKKVAR